MLSAATLVKAGAMIAALSQLEGTSSTSNNSADQSAQTSGFSSKNSGQPIKTPAIGQNGPPNPGNNTLTNAVSNTNPAGQPLGNSTTAEQLKTNTVSTTIIPLTIPPAPNNHIRTQQSRRAQSNTPI